jgi:formylglycine-generating enzyme required for sulfatase activity/tRNA A-37 threonylcarbamoyl transferase component Bud32
MTDTLTRLAAALADRYRFQRELGQGGMATVYLAEDLKHHRTVAVKVFRPDVAATLGVMRFLNEIEIAAQLEHPHILTLIDSGEVDGVPYYVMPFVAGESLRTKLTRETKLSIADAVRMLRDVADGLAEAHRHDLVHRDVKPDNVMISGNHAVVTDFGVAKALSTATGAQRVTTAGMAVGTPTYMSPEQASAEPSIDHRTDIYSLGVMAYELLTGRPPFQGGNAQAVLAALLTVEPANVSTLRPEVPPVLADLVMRCLAKSREERWQTMDEVVQRLEAMATPGAGVPPVSPLGRRSASRKRLVRRFAAWGSLAVLAGILLAVQQRRSHAVHALANELLPLAQGGHLDSVYESLRSAGTSIGARGLQGIAALAGSTFTLVTDPPGATVTLNRVGPGLRGGAEVKPERKTPILGRVLVAGSYVVAVAAPGYQTLDFSLDVAVGDTSKLHRGLVADDWGAVDMALVDSGQVVGPLADEASGMTVPVFLIDRHEVTNEAFQRFVAAGGYAEDSLWPDTLLVGGHRLPRREALATFVDKSGLPGPRTWTGGSYPADHADYPVTGVSWYEAAAFAQWSGKRLPTWQQWWRAALGDVDRPYPWGRDHVTLDERSNFGMVAASAVDRHPTGVSPYGAYDMAGNVREWLGGEADADRHPAIGGSWQDPTYTFYNPNLERFEPGFASEAIGFRLVKSLPEPNR